MSRRVQISAQIQPRPPTKPLVSAAGTGKTHDREPSQAQVRDRISCQHTAAVDAGTRRDELLAEQRLRVAMPQTQRIAETAWRIEATQAEQLAQLQEAVRQLQAEAAAPGPAPLEVEVEVERDYLQRSLSEHSYEIDRDGPSLGL